MIKCILSTLAVLALLVGFPGLADAQSTASQTIPGYLTTSGCPSGQTVCFIPYGSSIPISNLNTNPVFTTQASLIPIANSFQNLSSLGTATSLTVPTGAHWAFVTVEGAAVRYRDDGTPTSSVGQPLPIGGHLVYVADLSSIEFIQQSSGASIDVSYYK